MAIVSNLSLNGINHCFSDLCGDLILFLFEHFVIVQNSILNLLFLLGAVLLLKSVADVGKHILNLRKLVVCSLERHFLEHFFKSNQC